MTAAPQQQAPNILIVDDTPANVLLLVRMLEERGYKPRSVLSGKLALQAARTEPPDLILLDIAMPEMNGYEVCKQFKADAALKEIPVIFISALSETIDKVKAFGAGGVDYVTKPFQFEEVYARIQTHLQLRQLQIERESQNRRLQESYDQLRKLEELRDNLTHMIVHDMRSPLMVITLGLEVHSKRAADKLSEAELEPLVNATTAAHRLIDMISSLLDVSRLESGKMPIHLEECDLTGLTGEVIQSLKDLKEDCRLDMAQHDPVAVRCDRELIRRVLTNLGANAMKFIPRNGIVTYDVQSTDAGVKVLVTDNGPGIPREFHKKIFEKFGQVEAHQQRKTYSTGLGLTFCKLAVEAHGGEIGVDSEEGKGSTFWFTLPRLNPSPGVS